MNSSPFIASYRPHLVAARPSVCFFANNENMGFSLIIDIIRRLVPMAAIPPGGAEESPPEQG